MSSISIDGVFAALLFLILLFFNKEVDSGKVNYRLPSVIKPINYKIEIKPYLNEFDPRKFTFDGECFIEIKAVQKTKEIQLHMKNLNIYKGEYYRKGGEVKTSLPQVTPNNLIDIVIYNLSEELQANVSYILHYVYVGIINEDMNGLYRSQYKTSNNEIKWIAATQFKPHNARLAFPCFDEPEHKATFDLNVTRHYNLTSTGPTRRVGVKIFRDYTTDVYKTTPKMSTYLLAFLVSEFTGPFNGGFGVLARPEYESQTNYSYNVGRQLLNEFDIYFGIPYFEMGNEKMHLAAIPDFSPGSMENWGLVTLRERRLLFDKDHSTLYAKQSIAAAIAHELAHMYFGNLVTSVWWSYIWMHEGFATYFAYHGTHLVESSFDMPSQFVVNEMQYVMEVDSTHATSPLSDEDTNTPYDWERMLNEISYAKGASFIRMTKYILGEDDFRASLKLYLKTHQYANTVPSDLFKIWKIDWPTEFAQFAESYFRSFTTQVGYPVVTFNRINETTFQVTQKRFLMKDFNTADSSLTYTVPITYTTSSKPDFDKTFPEFFLQQNPFFITVSENVSWIIGNIQETGFYRVDYDLKSWNQIQKILLSKNRNEIHVLNRAQIVDDVFKFARSGRMDYVVALSILEFLQYETSYLPWCAALDGLYFLKTRLGKVTNDFASYILSISNNSYNQLGFKEMGNDTTFNIYHRAQILDLSCQFGNSECIANAKLYFNKNLTLNKVPVNIRKVVYCTAMREGNEADFNKLLNKYMTETVPTEKVIILYNMGCVKDSKLVSRFFDIVISNDVRRQNRMGALNSLFTKNHENVGRFFELVDQNIEKLAKSLGDYSDVAYIIFLMANEFSTETELQKLKTFIDKHTEKFGSSIYELQEAVRNVEYNLQWSNKYLKDVESFLKNRTFFNVFLPKL